jgi:hypothetical protein
MKLVVFFYNNYSNNSNFNNKSDKIKILRMHLSVFFNLELCKFALLAGPDATLTSVLLESKKKYHC